MKAIKFVLCLVALLGVSFANAQQSGGNTIPVTEPEWAGTVYLLSGAELIALERQIPSVNERNKGEPVLGITGGYQYYEYKGATSPTRVKMPVFVMRIESSENPENLLGLDRAIAKKNSREIISVVYASIFKGGKALPPPKEQTILLRFERYGKSSVRIIPDADLLPGEYIFTTAFKGNPSFLFTKIAESPLPDADATREKESPLSN